MVFVREAEQRPFYFKDSPPVARYKEVFARTQEVQLQLYKTSQTIVALEKLSAYFPNFPPSNALADFGVYTSPDHIYDLAMQGVGKLTEVTYLRRLTEKLVQSSHPFQKEPVSFSLYDSFPSFGYGEALFANNKARERWERREGVKDAQWQFLRILSPKTVIYGKEYIHEEDRLPLSPTLSELDNVVDQRIIGNDYSALKKTCFDQVFVEYLIGQNQVRDIRVLIEPVVSER